MQLKGFGEDFVNNIGLMRLLINFEFFLISRFEFFYDPFPKPSNINGIHDHIEIIIFYDVP
jgi:hypothetical protein